MKAEIVTVFPRIMVKLAAETAIEKSVLEEFVVRKIYVESYGGRACGEGADRDFDVRIVTPREEAQK